MRNLKVGNAPCSWGLLENQDKSKQIPFDRMLDELKETGYTATELGDWGYMPTDPPALHEELAKRELTMLGAFVPVAMKFSAAHDEGAARAVQTAKLLSAVAGYPAPYLVLADDNGTDPIRTQMAGRIPAGAGLTRDEWRVFAAGANKVARAVFDATGLRTVFHHHSAGYVETPDEIATLLELTDPDKLGLVFDSGHYLNGAGVEGVDLLAALQRFKERIWYIHLKDIAPSVAHQARKDGWDYFTAMRNGLFCELGQGAVDFPALLRWLAERDYHGYTLVEQDVLPGMGTPKESAARNRAYLRSIETHFTSNLPVLEKTGAL
jgi:inosose dehydratase